MPPVIAAMTRYTRRAGSSRLRHFAHFARLREAGFDVRSQCLLSDGYLDGIYGQSPKLTLKLVLEAYARRASFIAGLPKGTIGWIEKELFAWTPALVDHFAMSRFRATVLDFDDAWFARYEGASKFPARLLQTRLAQIIAKADIVTVANDYLADEVSARGARNVRIIGQAIDAEYYRPRDQSVRGAKVTIGWIGTPLNAAQYLPPVVDALNRLARDYDCRILLIGAGTEVPDLQAERREWSEATELSDLQQFDIGIMPLTDTVWNRCKSGYKLVQSMACGQVAVGSAVGFNNNLIDHGIDGLLVDTHNNNWFDVLKQVVRDERLRLQLGDAARQKVLRKYPVRKRSDELIALFRTFT